MIFREADGFSFRDLPFYARRPFSLVIVVPPTGRHDDFSVDDFGPHEMRVGKAERGSYRMLSSFSEAILSCFSSAEIFVFDATCVEVLVRSFRLTKYPSRDVSAAPFFSPIIWCDYRHFYHLKKHQTTDVIFVYFQSS